MVTVRFLLLAGGVLCALAFIFSCSSEDTKEGLLEYGGQTYRTIVINGQELMAENLNYAVPGSKCYDNNPANCAAYGMLYDWVMAMALPHSCISLSCENYISTPHKGICPSGWHVPTNAEWDKLYRFVDGDNGTHSPYDSPTAGRYLKAKQGWRHCGPSGPSSSSGRSSSSSRFSSSSLSGSAGSSGSSSSSGRSSSSSFSSSSSLDDKPYLCDDAFGFAALPGGCNNLGGFNGVGEYGYWWSTSEKKEDSSATYSSAAHIRYIYNRFEDAYWGPGPKNYFYSVRCFKD
ncbi:MAG: hypothetical protein LBC64_04020 [Fibromonadaceae bacterium]|nr:hypothetical protein [Fibromonadaceae bacterium]